MIWDVFVSYSRNDMIVADKICKSLKKIGLNIFIDRTCIPLGADYEVYLRTAIRKSKIFLFIASKNSWKSVWGLQEIREFLDYCDISRFFVLRIDKFSIPEIEKIYIDGIANLYELDNSDINTLAIEIEDMCNDIIIEDSKETLFLSSQRAFISHSHEDNELADRLYSFIRGNGFDCWIDLYDIPPGVSYVSAITEGLQSCQTIIVLYSKNVLYSANVLNELEIAHKSNMKIIPFIIDNTPLRGEFIYYLSRKQWVKSNEDSLEEAFKKILGSLK